MGKILSRRLLAPVVTLVIATVPYLLTSCNTAGCTELRSAVPRADFYSSATGKTISIDSLSISGLGAPDDAELYGPADRLSSVYLPMPALKDRVEWRIAYMQKALAEYDIADTITLDFERTPWFAGAECGAMYKYRINRLAYTTNVIDSVALTDSLVINVETVTMAVYFCTSGESRSATNILVDR